MAIAGLKMGRVALIALSLVTAQTAETAQAACIDEPVVTAARLHEFELMMMDVSLRCARIGIAMQTEYDGMIAAHRTRFDAAAGRLKQFFGSLTGPDQQHGTPFERYTTMMANVYGAGNTSISACQQFTAVAAAVAHAGDDGRTLLLVVKGLVAHPLLERATCALAP